MILTEDKCAKNSIEEWNLIEGMNLKEERNSTEDMILIQDFHFGGCYFSNKTTCLNSYQLQISW